MRSPIAAGCAKSLRSRRTLERYGRNSAATDWLVVANSFACPAAKFFFADRESSPAGPFADTKRSTHPPLAHTSAATAEAECAGAEQHESSAASKATWPSSPIQMMKAFEALPVEKPRTSQAQSRTFRGLIGSYQRPDAPRLITGGSTRYEPEYLRDKPCVFKGYL